MPVELAPRLLARADRVSRQARLGVATEAVLNGGVGLPLELEEIADREVLGLQPAEERRIVLGRAGEVDVVIARDPGLRGRSLPNLPISSGTLLLRNLGRRRCGRGARRGRAVALDVPFTRNRLPGEVSTLG